MATHEKIVFFRFVSQHPGLPVHQKGLEAAEHKSHAARVFYWRRRAWVEHVAHLPATAPHVRDDKTTSELTASVGPVRDKFAEHAAKPSTSAQSPGDTTACRYLARYLKGNCDPFASYVITVSLCINQPLNFMREAVYPAMYFHLIF